MSDAESNLFIRRLFLVLSLGIVAYFARDLLKLMHEMEGGLVVEDVELFLKSTRLQNLIVPEQQSIIDEITKHWISNSYQGPMKPIKVKDWQRSSITSP